MILSRRVNDDDHRDGFTKWPFMTTHTWGEYPQGTWLLEVNKSICLSLLTLFFRIQVNKCCYYYILRYFPGIQHFSNLKKKIFNV